MWQDKNIIGGTDAAPIPLMLTGLAGRSLLEKADTILFLGLHRGVPLFGADLSSLTEDNVRLLIGQNLVFIDLRTAGWLLPREQAGIMAYARGLAYWHKMSRYCGICGSPTKVITGGHVRKCKKLSCGKEWYPRTDPAVIMLVVDDGFGGQSPRCLLGRHVRWNFAMYSTLAGFVEPGESLEEAVAREVLEEAGLVVDNVTYMASQPWPFPASLMLGFRAIAVTKTINVDTEELTDARWFTPKEITQFGEWGADIPDDVPRLPRKDSIARWLIENWLRDVS